MRRAVFLIVLSVSIPVFAATGPTDSPMFPCPPGQAASDYCNPSRKDLKQASAAFSKGNKLQAHKRIDEAYEQFDIAARLVPRNVNYVTALELARQQSVYAHLNRGNSELLGGKQAESLNDFHAAMQLDPKNEFARQRVSDALAEMTPDSSQSARLVEESTEIRVIPDHTRLDFHFRGDSRDLLTQIARAFHIDIRVDDSVVSRRVRFDLTDVDFVTAMNVAGIVTKTFYSPLDEKQILVLPDNPENHRLYDRMSMRTFYISGVNSPTDLTNVSNVLRTIFDVRFITAHANSGTITLRAPQNILDAATEYLESRDDARPQVMLDIRIYQISHTFMRNLGVQIPNQFNLFNIPVAALAGLAGQNIQSLINQLISSGGINQANTTSISGLLAQLQGQANSIFSQPLATFGGGLTFEGLSLGTGQLQASLNESWAKDLQHAFLRVSQGNDATFHLGTRVPILNATFAPIFNTPAISQVLQNNTFQAPFPSFNYEDVGLVLKAKPLVGGNSEINLQLSIQVRTIAGQSVNGVPIINNREYTGSITLKDGEPAFVAGAVSHDEQRLLSGLPGLGEIPLLNQVVTTSNKQVDDDELMVAITPRIIQRSTQENSEIWITR